MKRSVITTVGFWMKLRKTQARPRALHLGGKAILEQGKPAYIELWHVGQEPGVVVDEIANLLLTDDSLGACNIASTFHESYKPGQRLLIRFGVSCNVEITGSKLEFLKEWILKICEKMNAYRETIAYDDITENTWVWVDGRWEDLAHALTIKHFGNYRRSKVAA